MTKSHSLAPTSRSIADSYLINAYQSALDGFVQQDDEFGVAEVERRIVSLEAADEDGGDP